MPNPSPLRALVGTFEKELTPPLQRLLSSGEFAELVSAAARAQSSARSLTGSAAAGVWRLVNLPSGTDVQRVRILVAELDGEVRSLQRQIDQREEADHVDADDAAGSA